MRWYIVTGVAWSVCLSVCLLDTTERPATTAEPIEAPFGGRTHVGPRYHELGDRQIPLGNGQFGET